jgi:hypothetical protein
LNFFIFSVTAAVNRKTKIKRANFAKETHSLITYSDIFRSFLIFIDYLKKQKAFQFSLHKIYHRAITISQTIKLGGSLTISTKTFSP